MPGLGAAVRRVVVVVRGGIRIRTMYTLTDIFSFV